MYETGEWSGAAVRSIQVGAIYGDPQIFPIPEVHERIVEARVLAIVAEVLMVVNLEHAAMVELLHLVIAELRFVPGGRIGGIYFLKFPEQGFEPLDVLAGYCVRHDHI